MNRSQLEHIIRAAAGNTDANDIVVIGSQAILAAHPDAPSELLVSVEADVFPRDRPSDSILIDGAIGERSLFHETYGYYAHGVDETTATLPVGWRDRLVPIQLRYGTCWFRRFAETNFEFGIRPAWEETMCRRWIFVDDSNALALT